MTMVRSWLAPVAVSAALFGCGDAPRTCGTGTVDRGGTCVPAPVTAPFTEITVTHLNVPYDESRPVFVGHRLPLRIGITSRSAQPLGAPRTVAMNISMIEHATGTPTATQAAALRQCIVRGFEAELSGNGEEQLFEPTVEIPPECLPSGAESVTYNLVIQVDMDERALPADAERASYFTEAAQAVQGANGRCRSSMDPAAPVDGCVHRMIVRASPGTDVSERVTPDGRIALFWQGTQPNETQREMMTVHVDRRAYGHDPFDIASADADRLPGAVTQRVRIAPATGPHAGEYRPLRVQAAEMGAAPTETRAVERLAPASDNRYDYELFPTEEVMGLVSTGEWRDVNDFMIEACLEPAFEERGEDGDVLNEGEEGAAPHTPRSDDCRRFAVLGVRAQPAAAPSLASRLDFNREWSRHWGNDKIGLEARFNTENYVIVGGAVTDTTGRVALVSRYLPDITLVDAKAYAGVDLFQVDRTGVELRVDVFGIRALGYERRVPESRELYNRDWSVMKRQCKSGRVQVGPVPVGLEGCVQGTLGLNVNVGLYRDAAIENRRFATHDAEGQIVATVTPYLTIGASASVSVDLLVVRGGVEGQITVLDVRAPVTGSAAVGLMRSDPATMRPSAEANLNVSWRMILTGLNGRILLFVDTRGVQWCRKRVWFVNVSYPCGFTWDRRGDLTLFTFGADPETFTLFDRTFANFRLAP